MNDASEQQEVVIVTGPAGAGRMTAINALADLGFETIDNLPLAFFSRLVSGPALGQSLAVGVDTRTRGFSVEALLGVMAELETAEGVSATLLYLDCSTEQLLRRFSETRRRHPLAQDGTPTLGIDREQDLLSGLRERADVLVDTSDLSPHDLRAQLARWFSDETSARLSVSVQSFSYKRGIPRGVDMVIDCRFLNNPHWVPELRAFTGQDKPVAQYVTNDPRHADFFAKLCDLLDLLLPAYRAEGKAYFSIALGCTGGQHRSVCVAEGLAKHLKNAGWQVSKRHRELERRNPSA